MSHVTDDNTCDFKITCYQFQLREFKSFGRSFNRWWRWWVIPWTSNSKLFFKSEHDCWISSSPSSSTAGDLHGIRRNWSSTSKLHPCLNLLFDNKYLLLRSVMVVLLSVHFYKRNQCGKLYRWSR